MVLVPPTRVGRDRNSILRGVRIACQLDKRSGVSLIARSRELPSRRHVSKGGRKVLAKLHYHAGVIDRRHGCPLEFRSCPVDLAGASDAGDHGHYWNCCARAAVLNFRRATAERSKTSCFEAELGRIADRSSTDRSATKDSFIVRSAVHPKAIPFKAETRSYRSKS